MNAPYPDWEIGIMSYAKPLYKIHEYNSAARQFVALEPTDRNMENLHEALHKIDNWRASHAFPLNTFHVTLKKRAKKISTKSETAQRLKRLHSIALKLLLKSDMKLSQMQDIGGCRAIVPTINDVYALRSEYKTRPVTHTYSGEKDYIKEPKPDGYRGIHLKYRFVGRSKSAPYNNLKIEIQLRTLLQHQWATAVEAVDTFTSQALKSSQGKKEWQRFFALMSSVFALNEGCPLVPGTPQTLGEIYEEIKSINKEHHIVAKLAQLRSVIPHIERGQNAKYFLLKLDPEKMELNVQKFAADQSQAASKAYTDAEASLGKKSTVQIVLVSVANVAALKRAYPNYFLDTEGFMKEVSFITDFF